MREWVDGFGFLAGGRRVKIGPRRSSEHSARKQNRNVERWQRIMAKHRIYTMSVASVYPHYIAKAEKKGRTKSEVDEIIRWLTGYSQEELEAKLEQGTDFKTFLRKLLT